MLVVILPPTCIVTQSTYPLISLSLGVQLQQEIGLLQFASLGRALSQGSEALLGPSIITDGFHRGHRRLMNLHPFKTPFEQPFLCLTFLWPPPGQDLSFVRMFHLILGNLEQKGGRGWWMTLHERGNVLWSLQAEMRFKWSARQWFVILLIRFGGDPLRLCTEKGLCLPKVAARAGKAQSRVKRLHSQTQFCDFLIINPQN